MSWDLFRHAAVMPLFGVLVYELLNGGFSEDERIVDLHTLQSAAFVPAVNRRNGDVQVLCELLSPKDLFRLLNGFLCVLPSAAEIPHFFRRKPILGEHARDRNDDRI